MASAHIGTSGDQKIIATKYMYRSSTGTGSTCVDNRCAPANRHACNIWSLSKYRE